MRWLLLPIGLAVAGLAAWLLLSTPTPRTAPPVGAPPGAAGPAENDPPPGWRRPAAPEEHIDEASRRQLDAVLEREGIDP